MVSRYGAGILMEGIPVDDKFRRPKFLVAMLATRRAMRQRNDLLTLAAMVGADGYCLKATVKPLSPKVAVQIPLIFR